MRTFWEPHRSKYFPMYGRSYKYKYTHSRLYTQMRFLALVIDLALIVNYVFSTTSPSRAVWRFCNHTLELFQDKYVSILIRPRLSSSPSPCRYKRPSDRLFESQLSLCRHSFHLHLKTHTHCKQIPIRTIMELDIGYFTSPITDMIEVAPFIWP